MKLLSRLPAPGRKMKVALGVLAAFALLLALFDWNWFRPALERHLTRTSQRAVQIADLHLGLDAALQPTVRLRGVHIQNAPWADPRPFAVAGEARFTFDWASLFDDVRIVTQLVLVDADIDLERQADGLRNWRLTRPDDRGPARLRVLSLEAHNSRLRLIHHGIGLALQTAATALPEADGPFTQRIEFSGTLHGTPFSGDTLAGPVLSLQRTGDFFALRGQARSGATRLQLDGRIADLVQLGGIDAHAQLSGPSLSQLKPFFPTVPWPASKPYRAEAQVTRQDTSMAAKDLRLTLGSSDLAGELSYDKPDERASLQATLRSDKLNVAELASLIDTGAKPSSKISKPSLRVLPQTALPLQRLHDIDARLSLNLKTVQLPDLPDLHELRASATLKQGLLQLALLDAELAAGRVSGQFALDSRQATPSVRIDLRARGLRLEKLWPNIPDKAGLEGPLSGQAKLSARGESVAAWAGSANGQLSLTMEGGLLSNRLDAKLGLNAGKLLRSFFSERQVPLRCGAVAIDFDNGIGTTRQFVIDTDQTHVEGQGSLHLRDETWAVLLTPQARKPAPLALHSSVLAKGSFRDFSYSLDGSKRASTAASGACTAACAAATSSGCG